jgi:hypothetical protein
MMNEDFRHRAEQVFRGLLWRVQAKPLAASVTALVEEAQCCAATQPSADEAFSNVYQSTRGTVLTQVKEF